ncbi:GT-D fold domain-containing glycosyltransferase [Mesobacillus jeotgali]|uniref:GT-D fold domain-containing glycosyltransferase n=1 Tax=Mesobacillus jeotgali TaxID=129985 RepID=A0ABY9VHH6_9BACI|nr:GT-D fold domain-containing glycosyltransferase [Mesobacillus jeotgali]WNF23300.1 GT-D fold domain-containing glycosyltransferase [Mesobacillus jeotgali]
MINFSKQEWEDMKKFGHIEKGNEKNIAVEGLYYGGDKIVGDRIKKYEYVPFSIEEIIHAGLSNLKDKKVKLKNANDIAQEIRKALHESAGYSVIRLGDGELIFLSHDVLNPTDSITNNPRFNFLSYAGVQLPNHGLRDHLTEALLEADALGIPIARYPTFQNLFTKLSKHYKWNLEKMNLVSSNIHFEILKYTTLLDEILKNYKVLLIGNRMAEGVEYFKKLGYENVVGNIPVKGINSVPSVIEQASQFDYDVALVSAGIPANLICVNLAKSNKIAIDFGHTIDWLLSGDFNIKSFDNGAINSSNCFDIAYYYFSWDDFKTAAFWYEKIVELEKSSTKKSVQNLTIAHIQLAVCYWELGDLQTAYEHNEQARILAPNDPSVLQNKNFFEGQLKK